MHQHANEQGLWCLSTTRKKKHLSGAALPFAASISAIKCLHNPSASKCVGFVDSLQSKAQRREIKRNAWISIIPDQVNEWLSVLNVVRGSLMVNKPCTWQCTSTAKQFFHNATRHKTSVLVVILKNVPIIAAQSKAEESLVYLLVTIGVSADTIIKLRIMSSVYPCK